MGLKWSTCSLRLHMSNCILQFVPYIHIRWHDHVITANFLLISTGHFCCPETMIDQYAQATKSGLIAFASFLLYISV